MPCKKKKVVAQTQLAHTLEKLLFFFFFAIICDFFYNVPNILQYSGRNFQALINIFYILTTKLALLILFLLKHKGWGMVRNMLGLHNFFRPLINLTIGCIKNLSFRRGLLLPFVDFIFQKISLSIWHEPGVRCVVNLA